LVVNEARVEGSVILANSSEMSDKRGQCRYSVLSAREAGQDRGVFELKFLRDRNEKKDTGLAVGSE